MVGGLVVPLWSSSPLSVTGPAVGLFSIVLMEVERLGSVEAFLTAVLLAGVMQILLGVLRAGRFSAIVPASVIKGMLASIGITIILKQIPVAFGVKGGLSAIATGLNQGAALITAVSLVVLYGWKKTPLGRFQFLPPALAAVVLGSALASVLSGMGASSLPDDQFVRVPLGGFAAFSGALPRPDWSVLSGSAVWIAGLTIAVVASIETLLSCQAVDRLDPLKRHSSPDRELVAQGAANAISGVLGGLPVTAIIVRSGANVAAGGRERLSAITHGVLLLLAAVFLAPILNQIPLACLAAVLIQVGLNLCKPILFVEQKRLGLTQFLPFLITIGAVLATDLLKGVIIGMLVGMFFVLHQNAQGAVEKTKEPDGRIRVKFRRDATFLVKPALMTAFESIKDGSRVIIDGQGGYVDQDVKEAIAGFIEDAQSRKIDVSLIGI
jgi:MFS superfamily sulfate permease-like transporter